MRELTQSEWHRIASSYKVVELDGCIIGVICYGETILFDR